MNENRPDVSDLDPEIPASDIKPGVSADGNGSRESLEASDELIVATLADEDETVRAGSPFAVDPEPAPAVPKQIEPLLDVGPLRYTAMGAVAAAAMVLVFAAVAAWWFPAGGALIAALGCVLSIFGLYSQYRWAAAGLLALHLSLFVFSYGQTLA